MAKRKPSKRKKVSKRKAARPKKTATPARANQTVVIKTGLNESKTVSVAEAHDLLDVAIKHGDGFKLFRSRSLD